MTDKPNLPPDPPSEAGPGKAGAGPGKPGINRQAIQLEIPPDLEPIYSNVARISHTPSDFIMDFARFLPGQTPSRVMARLLMSPMGLKLFFLALGENLARYEATFGEIKLPPGNTGLAGDLFRRVQPPEPPEAPPEGEEPQG